MFALRLESIQQPREISMQPNEIELLKQRIAELENEVKHLSMSPSYQVLTRGAVERRWITIDKTDKSMILFDIDHLHNQNQKNGHEEMNRRIRLGLSSIRSSELLGLVYSGDEFVAVVSSADVELMSQRLRDSFYEHGITLTTIIFTIETNDFNDNYQRAVKKVSELKSENKRDSITQI